MKKSKLLLAIFFIFAGVWFAQAQDYYTVKVFNVNQTTGAVIGSEVLSQSSITEGTIYRFEVSLTALAITKFNPFVFSVSRFLDAILDICTQAVGLHMEIRVIMDGMLEEIMMIIKELFILKPLLVVILFREWLYVWQWVIPDHLIIFQNKKIL